MKMAGAQMGVAVDHVSSMKTCFFEENKVRKLDPSQKWKIQALYDYDKFPGNKNEAGKQEEIMAIAIMYVAVKPGTMLTAATSAAAPAADAGGAPAAGGAALPPGAGRPKGLPPKGLGKGRPKLPQQPNPMAPPAAGAPQQNPAMPPAAGASQQNPAAPPAAPPMADMPGMEQPKRNWLNDEAYWEEGVTIAEK